MLTRGNSSMKSPTSGKEQPARYSTDFRPTVLMSLCLRAARGELRALVNEGVRVRLCGRSDRLPTGTRSALEQFLKDYPASASACLATASTDTTPGATGGSRVK